MTDDTPATILVAEDDPPTRSFLADELCADGCELLVADCARDALRLIETRFPDLAVLDVGLPDGSGLRVVRAVRTADSAGSRIDTELPLLVLSGRSGEHDRVRAFEAGADDFVAKPFAYPELRARIRALLRRSEGRRRTGRLRVGALELDPTTRDVRVAGTAVALTQTEFSLLRILAGSPTTVHTKSELLKTIWGYRSRSTSRTLDSHACRLRRKLAVAGDRYVISVWGVGYRLIDDPGTALDALRTPTTSFAPAAPDSASLTPAPLPPAPSTPVKPTPLPRRPVPPGRAHPLRRAPSGLVTPTPSVPLALRP